MNGTVLGRSKWSIGNGTKICLWEDTWCGTEKFMDRFPLIYALAINKSATVREAAGFDGYVSWNIPVARNLDD